MDTLSKRRMRDPIPFALRLRSLDLFMLYSCKTYMLCTRCPDKLLSLEDQSKSPRRAGRNSLISPEKRGVDCSHSGAR